MTATLDRAEVRDGTIPPERVPVVDASPRTTFWLVALVVLGGVLRFWGLGASRLDYDESFTVMAGRLPIGSLVDFLRSHDSHPPLDYLLRAPFARAGVSEFWVRAPSALLSLGALALFAWWMRPRGRAGVLATAFMAVSAFQVVHGREARMYAELELLGVAIVVLAASWRARPRAWHAPALGALVLAGLLTHVSMFLLAGGLVALPGRRTDRDAWRWRAAIAVGALGWAAIWGSVFITQARGGHSGWIPPTTVSGLGTAISRLVTFEPSLMLVVALAIIVGGVIVCRRDRALGLIWVCCFAVPVGIAALAGFFEPVVLDRTFTLFAWAPCVALAYLFDALWRRQRSVGAIAIVALLAVMVPSTLRTIQARTGPDTPLRELAQLAKPGDIVAVRPASKAPELAWSLGVRGAASTRGVAVPGVPKAFGLRVGGGRPSDRTWLLDWRSFPHPDASAMRQCAARWSWGHAHIRCLRT